MVEIRRQKATKFIQSNLSAWGLTQYAATIEEYVFKKLKPQAIKMGGVKKQYLILLYNNMIISLMNKLAQKINAYQGKSSNLDSVVHTLKAENFEIDPYSCEFIISNEKSQLDFDIMNEMELLDKLDLPEVLKNMDNPDNVSYEGKVVCKVCNEETGIVRSFQDRSGDEGETIYILCQNKKCNAKYKT